MARTVWQRLEDIRTAIVDLKDYMEDVSDDAFHDMQVTNRQRYRAIKNALTELGEASKSIPEEMRGRYPEVRWKNFAGLRDIIAHHYFRLEADPLLLVIRNDVPKLLDAVEKELDEPEPTGGYGS